MTPIQAKAKKRAVRKRVKQTPADRIKSLKSKLIMQGLDPNLAPELPLADAPKADPAKPEIKLTADMLGAVARVFSGMVMRLMKASPRNPQLRAIILAKTRLAIPDSVSTYEELIYWLYDAVKPPPAPPAPITVPLLIDAGGFETGNCHYRLNANYEGEFQINSQKIVSLARDSDTWPTFRNYFYDWLADEIRRNDNLVTAPFPDGFHDREDVDYDDFYLNYETDQLKTLTMATLRFYDPESFRRLFPEPVDLAAAENVNGPDPDPDNEFEDTDTDPDPTPAPF